MDAASYRRLRLVLSAAAVGPAFGGGLALLGLIAYAGFTLLSAALNPYQPPDHPLAGLLVALAAASRWLVLGIGLVSYILIYLAPIAFGLPWLAPLITLWRPRAFVCLRPFHRGWPNRTLRAIIRRHLAPLGHTYTLADSDIRRGLLTRLPFIFGQLSLCGFGVRRVHHARRIDEIIERPVTRNLNWCFSWHKTFPVETASPVWQGCVLRLLEHGELVLFDITQSTPNLTWEMEQCRARGLGDRMICLAANNSTAAAGVALEIAGPAPVFLYDHRGVVDHEGFDRTLAAMLSRTNRAVPPASRATIAALVLFGIGFYPLLPLLVFFDVAVPAWLPQWTFWKFGAWPGVSQVAQPLALGVYAFGLITAVVLGFSAVAEPRLRWLLFVQLALLLAASFGLFPATVLFSLGLL